jgi:hypothetical protein
MWREDKLRFSEKAEKTAIKDAEKKDHWFTNVTFVFASLWKKAN